MKKNLFLRLCLMMGVFSIVFSCKTELLEDESTNPTTQNAIAKQILFKELQKQAPQIAKKVSKFSPVNISARTYTDSESDFSIDTEKSLYIEDAKGNKTYTFKMTRAENNESVLENLVLKDIGNGEFEAYIATYDSYALQNYSNLSLEDVKNHITMVYIGDRLGSDIFGKANAYTCYVMAPEFVDVYYTGEICGANLHYYGQTCNDEIKPTPGYTITTVQYTPYDMCEGGGASAGSGDGSGVTTAPYNGGYNGGGTLQVYVDPCDRIKKSTENSIYKADVTDLQGKTGLDHEEGYRLDNPIPNSGQTGIQNQTLPIIPGSNQIGFSVDGNTFALIHTHYDGLYPIFSPGDLISYNQWISQAIAWNAVPSNTPKISVNDLTVTVVTSQGSYLIAFEGATTNAFPNYSEDEITDFNRKYEESLSGTLIVGSNLYDMQKLEQEFLSFISTKMNMIGLKLYRVKSDGNYEISLTDLVGTKCL